MKRIREDVCESKRDRRWTDDIDDMHKALNREGIQDPVMEIFSPLRVNGMALRLGIMPGLSLDLSGNDPDDGRPWASMTNANVIKPWTWC